MAFQIKIEIKNLGFQTSEGNEMDMPRLRKIGGRVDSALQEALENEHVEGRIRIEYSHTTYGGDGGDRRT